MNAPATVTNEVLLAALLDKQRAAFLRDGPPTLAQRIGASCETEERGAPGPALRPRDRRHSRPPAALKEPQCSTSASPSRIIC